MKKQRHHFADKGLYSQSSGFSSSPDFSSTGFSSSPVVQIWELDPEEGWVLKNLMLSNCGVGEASWRVPSTAGRSNQSILKEINPEYSLEGLVPKLQSLATWCEELTHWKRLWCWERLMAEGEGAAEDEMVSSHHRFNGHEFEQTLGDSEGQGSLAWCSPWGCKVRQDLLTEQQYDWTSPRTQVCFLSRHSVCPPASSLGVEFTAAV